MPSLTIPENDMLTVLEAARELNITRRNVYELIASGRLPGSVLVGMQRLIPRQVVEDRMQLRRSGGRQQGRIVQ